MAIGLAFLIAPSGWIVRLLSPWATGWTLPPDLATLQDRAGLALDPRAGGEGDALSAAGLPGGARASSMPRRGLGVARGLGYGPPPAWVKVVLPQLYPLIRLPVYAVLAFGLSVVDVALILGPATPPPLAPLILRWANDPDLAQRFPAAAAACLQLALAAAAIALWAGGRAAGRDGSPARWLAGGGRGIAERLWPIVAGGLMTATLGLAAAGTVGMGLWSVASVWRFPAALPTAWTLRQLAARARRPRLAAVDQPDRRADRRPAGAGADARLPGERAAPAAWRDRAAACGCSICRCWRRRSPSCSGCRPGWWRSASTAAGWP